MSLLCVDFIQKGGEALLRLCFLASERVRVAWAVEIPSRAQLQTQVVFHLELT